jgi:hypothetical protein
MATLYFNDAVDNDWDEIGNWWTSDTFTTQASALPSSSDSVVLSASVTTNSGSSPTVVNLTITDSNLDIEVTVTGMATFNSSELYFPNGSIIGNATFNGSSVCSGGIDGHVVFNDTSSVGSSNTLGNSLDSLTFNDYSVAKDISLTNASIPITFNDYAVCEPDSDLNFGDCTIIFNDYSSTSDSFIRRSEGAHDRITMGPNATITFNDNSLYWVDAFSSPTGGWTFNDRAVNNSLTNPGAIATFNPSRGINGSSILGIL